MPPKQPTAAIPQPGALEHMLERDRLLVLASVVVISVIAWAWLALLASDMAQGDMRLMGMGQLMASKMTMSSMAWTLTTFAAMFAMWWVMMIGMMLPSAAPMILLYSLMQRKKKADENPFLRTVIFTIGYLLLWGLFSALATSLQWGLGEATLLSPMMITTSQWLAVGLFALAAVYQLTPLKHACLAQCAAPFAFLSRHWKDGNTGALDMGLRHALFCIGCCWALMLLLFVGGVMNLAWVAVIAILVLAEKILPRGDLVATISGILMAAFAVFLAMRLTGLA
jgi:predicted metal-binding membrane protein